MTGPRAMSTAVMNRRNTPPDALDDFPTPPWGTRALIEKLRDIDPQPLELRSVWEPACNRGFMARPLAEAFGRVRATDVFDYGAPGVCQDVCDFLSDWAVPEDLAADPADWIITNPPFKVAAKFADAALRRARTGVALLCRGNWKEGCERYGALFKAKPFTYELVFCERLGMAEGCCDPEVDTATAYAWFVWRKPVERGRDPRTRWIEPGTRRRLERTGDYPPEYRRPPDDEAGMDDLLAAVGP